MKKSLKNKSARWQKGNIPWNKGLTKEIDSRLKSGSKYGKLKPPYIKNCPECNSLMGYSTIYSLVGSINKNRKCNKCANKFAFRNSKRNGYERTPEIKEKARLARIEYIKRCYGTIWPNYNVSSITVIEEYGKNHGYNFQHAESGGEYHIKELGYWVDGYDKEKNVVIEYDEFGHYDKDGNLKKKDLKRQQKIEEFLSCKFIRIKEGELIL